MNAHVAPAPRGARHQLAPGAGLDWAALGGLAVVTIAAGRALFLRSEHRLRVRGARGQH